MDRSWGLTLNNRQRHEKFVPVILDSPRKELKPPTALSAGTLLTTCTQQCAIVVRRLEKLETLNQGGINGLMLSLSLSVVELRLRLWGQIASGCFDSSTAYCFSSIHPLQTLVKINGIICELDVVVNTLLRDTQPEVCEAPTLPKKKSTGGVFVQGLKSICAYAKVHTPSQILG